MALKILNIQDEVFCPICLELLTESLSLDCGHSFCQACITAKTKESTTNQGGESRCPVCRIRYCTGELRPNWHVANIVERLREVKVSPEEGQKINLCERHEEKLLLFCKTDGKIICWLCERSQEHRGHHTVLVEEIAQDYQVRDQDGGNTGQKTILDEQSPLCIQLAFPCHHRPEGCAQACDFVFLFSPSKT